MPSRESAYQTGKSCWYVLTKLLLNLTGVDIGERWLLSSFLASFNGPREREHVIDNAMRVEYAFDDNVLSITSHILKYMYLKQTIWGEYMTVCLGIQ